MATLPALLVRGLSARLGFGEIGMATAFNSDLQTARTAKGARKARHSTPFHKSSLAGVHQIQTGRCLGFSPRNGYTTHPASAQPVKITAMSN